MKKWITAMWMPALTALLMAQPAGAAAGTGGVSFRAVMNVVFGVMALALIGLRVWYLKLRKED